MAKLKAEYEQKIQAAKVRREERIVKWNEKYKTELQKEEEKGFGKKAKTLDSAKEKALKEEQALKAKYEKELKELNEEDDTDPFLDEAIETVIETQQASTSFIQRRFKVGYARAGRIIDQMEERGIISGYQGSKPREVLMSKERWQELNMQQNTESSEE